MKARKSKKEFEKLKIERIMDEEKFKKLLQTQKIRVVFYLILGIIFLISYWFRYKMENLLSYLIAFLILSIMFFIYDIFKK